MRRFGLLVVCGWFSLMNVRAQGEWEKQVDSLRTLAQTAPGDSLRAGAYNLLANLYATMDPKLAWEYNNRALDLAKKGGYRSILSDAYNTGGTLYAERGKEKEALLSYGASATFAEQTGDQKKLARAYLNISTVHYQQGEYDIALDLNLKALALYEALNDVLGILDVYVSIANVYAVKKDFVPAKFYYRKAHEGYRKLNDKVGEITALANLAGIYKTQDVPDSAQYYFEEVARLCENENMPYYLALAWEGLGSIYAQKNDFPKAHRYLDNAYALFQQMGVTYRCISVLAHRSDAFLKEKNYGQATHYALRTLDMALESDETELTRVAYGLLHTAYAAAGNYEKAYEYHLKYVAMLDSLNQSDNQKHLNELRTRFETEEKEKENKILANENKIQQLELSRNRYYVIGLAVLLVGGALLTWLLIRQYRLRTRKKAVELEQKLLRSQMNPHFIFNSLNSIESFIYEHQPREAGMYLSKFAKLMRLILDSSAKEYIPLEKETEILEYYLNLQKLRMHNRFDYEIETEDALFDNDIHLPPMLTQPFIENAVEHGIRGNAAQGLIQVRFSREGELLKIEIRDNGIGIDHAVRREGHSSMAMAITKERLLFLNRSKKQRLTFEVTDLSRKNAGETGTHIIFTIPLA